MSQHKPFDPDRDDFAIVLAELEPGKVSVGFRFGDDEYIQVFADGLTPQQATQMLQDIQEKRITAEDIAARDWRAVRLPAEQIDRRIQPPRKAKQQETPPKAEPAAEGLNVLRQDGREEPRAAEIRQDWRAWAKANGYRHRLNNPVSHGAMRIALELWQGPPPDQYLIYHPLIPGTSNTESLYILPDKEAAENFLDLARQMAKMVLATVAGKDAFIRDQKAQQN